MNARAGDGARTRHALAPHRCGGARPMTRAGGVQSKPDSCGASGVGLREGAPTFARIDRTASTARDASRRDSASTTIRAGISAAATPACAANAPVLSPVSSRRCCCSCDSRRSRRHPPVGAVRTLVRRVSQVGMQQLDHRGLERCGDRGELFDRQRRRSGSMQSSRERSRRNARSPGKPLLSPTVPRECCSHSPRDVNT